MFNFDFNEELYSQPKDYIKDIFPPTKITKEARGQRNLASLYEDAFVSLAGSPRIEDFTLIIDDHTPAKVTLNGNTLTTSAATINTIDSKFNTLDNRANIVDSRVNDLTYDIKILREDLKLLQNKIKEAQSHSEVISPITDFTNDTYFVIMETTEEADCGSIYEFSKTYSQLLGCPIIVMPKSIVDNLHFVEVKNGGIKIESVH